MNNDVSKKKKTSKEKRILIASLCIAAAVMAGSTFAWFSSSDEVTNRLTANADYGVSIVESFSPPLNWLPGQAVNKDVYATNTGNIGAFVEEDISGVLTITNEKPVDTFDASTCVELTNEERYVMEAGSFLAYKPAGDTKNQLGNQIVLRPADNGNVPSETDFTPGADGLYVFRRQIIVDDASQAETFKYEGYYYSGGKYYKISNLKVTPDTTIDMANDGVSNDGNLAEASCGWYEDVTKTVDPVALEYVDDAQGKRLVAIYDTGVVNQAYTDLENAAARLDAANHNVQYLTQLVAKAHAENDNNDGTTSSASTALNNARNDLNDALDAQRNAAAALLAATSAYNNAAAAQNAAENAYNASKNKLFGNGGSSTSPQDGSLLKTLNDATAAKNEWTSTHTGQAGALANEVNAWAATHPSGVDPAHTTLASLTAAELQLFTPSAELHELYELTAAELIAQTNYNNEMMRAYGKTNGGESAGDYEADSLYGVLQAANTAETTAQGNLDTATTNKNNADAAVTAAQTVYDQALADYTAALGENSETAATLNNLSAQLAAANAELTAAQNEYNTAAATAGAATSATNLLKFNIYLSDDVVTAGGTADKWQLLPNPISNDVAKFYYTSILEGGETSAKLVDRVELDGSATQDMYKAFDFDINVALKSAQIVYAEDNTTILATAANGDGVNAGELDAAATLANPTSIDTAITWN